MIDLSVWVIMMTMNAYPLINTIAYYRKENALFLNNSHYNDTYIKYTVRDYEKQNGI